MIDEAAGTLPAGDPRCEQCGTRLHPGQDREVTEGGTFCRPCFEALTSQLQHVLAEQGRDLPYGRALVGGLAGGALGALVWWGFTVLTHVAFGLVAVVIGIAVGKGIGLLSGHKRHLHLQIMSVVIALLSFAYASYLVNRTFIQRSLAEQGNPTVLPLVPDPALFFRVLQAGFGILDLVFLGIVVWEAWRLTAPAKLASSLRR
jgi:hypothetical protein